MLDIEYYKNGIETEREERNLYVLALKHIIKCENEYTGDYVEQNIYKLCKRINERNSTIQYYEDKIKELGDEKDESQQ